MDNAFEDNGSFDFPRPVAVAGVVPLWAKILIWPLRGLFGFALYYWLSNPPNMDPDFHFAVILAAVPWLCAEVPMFYLLLNRRWLLATDDGFTYSSWFGSETFSYDGIEGASLQVKELPNEIHFFGKGHTRVSRDFQMWLENRAKPIRLQFTSRTDKPDPLYGFILLALGKLAERFEQTLESGGTIGGHDWTFANSSLRYLDASGAPDSLPIDRIGAVETFGDRFYVWRRGESDACFSTAAQGKNVGWLSDFLERSITPEERHVDGLGRFLFEIKRTPTFVYIISFAVLLAGMIMVPNLVSMDGDGGIVVIIGEIIAGIILVALPFIWAFAPGKRFYENGFALATPFSETEISFDDVESYEWSRTDQYMNGAYAGSVFAFVLHMRPGVGARKFSLNHSNRKGEEGNYGIVRQKLTEHLGRRMGERLAAEKRVEWVKDIELTDTAVVFTQKKRGNVETTVLPYDQIEMFGMLENASSPTFGIVHKDGQQGLQFGTAHKNFFPGLHLFGEIMKKYLAPQEEPAEAEGTE